MQRQTERDRGINSEAKRSGLCRESSCSAKRNGIVSVLGEGRMGRRHATQNNAPTTSRAASALWPKATNYANGVRNPEGVKA